MLAGTLGIFEAVLHTAADTLREIDPRDERIVELERRVDSLEEQTTRRRESARSTSAARKSAPTASAASEPERSGSPPAHAIRVSAALRQYLHAVQANQDLFLRREAICESAGRSIV